MRKPLLSLTVSLALAGCATDPPPLPMSTLVPFRAADFAWSRAHGANTVRGSAVLRTVGGEAKTCAGLPVILVPEGAYTRERMTVLYGNPRSGFLRVGDQRAFENPPGYIDMIRQVPCDPEGHFSFQDVPEGSYFIVARVLWGIPNQYFTSWQGGDLMREVQITNGQAIDVVLTGN